MPNLILNVFVKPTNGREILPMTSQGIINNIFSLAFILFLKS